VNHNFKLKRIYFSSALSADPPCELLVFWCDGHAFSMNGAQVGVFHQSDKVALACCLQRHDRVRLKAQVCPEILRHLAHEALKRKLAAQEFGALLVLPNLAQSDSPRPASASLVTSMPSAE
jgi:hypothetical protein